MGILEWEDGSTIRLIDWSFPIFISDDGSRLLVMFLENFGLNMKNDTLGGRKE